MTALDEYVTTLMHLLNDWLGLLLLILAAVGVLLTDALRELLPRREFSQSSPIMFAVVFPLLILGGVAVLVRILLVLRAS